MNRKVVIIAAVCFMLGCIFMDRQALAMDRDQDPEQLWNIGWELSQESLTHRDPSRVEGKRLAQRRDPHQESLLQELLPPQEVRQASSRTVVKFKTTKRVRQKKNLREPALLDELRAGTAEPY